ncbi:Putative transcriptional regulator [Mycobacteroides abscessus subsp. abscessus]|nr:Putative transcriptional regulator [Mycobacteroides abscessus subsp. abscessus]
MRPWSCTAVPIHDPLSGTPLGSLDLTGGVDIASPQTLALVRATAVAVEHFIALDYPGRVQVDADTGPRLTLLGVGRPYTPRTANAHIGCRDVMPRSWRCCLGTPRA